MNKVILLTEDDIGFRNSVKNTLELEGYKVIEASDGLEALHILNESVVDLLITDILMPNMEGMQLLAKVRKSLPKLKVIGISGGGRRVQLSTITATAKYLFDSFLEKPLHRAELLSEIKFQIL
ncbi:response regulator [bacterium]|nr:response regulator [bacterium]